MNFVDVTSWFQSLGLSELEEHSCESSLKSRKDFQNDFQMVFKISKRGCEAYDQPEPVSRPQNTIPLFDYVIC